MEDDEEHADDDESDSESEFDEDDEEEAPPPRKSRELDILLCIYWTDCCRAGQEQAYASKEEDSSKDHASSEANKDQRRLDRSRLRRRGRRHCDGSEACARYKIRDLGCDVGAVQVLDGDFVSCFGDF